MKTREGRLVRYRLFDKPFTSYVGVGPVYAEWGNGLSAHVGRLRFAVRVRAGLLPRARATEDE